MSIRSDLRLHFPIDVLVTLIFAGLAWLLRGVNAGGAAAGFLVACILFASDGFPLFATVLLVFVMTHVATRFGRVQKRALTIDERSHHGRDAAQVFANLGLAAVSASLASLTPYRSMFLCASVAALAEAACDTVSSESGKALSQTARSIISWKPVPAGTDGGMTLKGTLIGAAAAGLVGCEARVTHLLSGRAAAAAVVGGVCGMFIDSLLGATLERSGWLTNNGVNFTSTVCATLVALAIG
jgi:uncharacterized protein (TIGR00297 family)